MLLRLLQCKHRVNPERERLCSLENQSFQESRSAAGNRTVGYTKRLKTEWIPNIGYRSITEATMDIDWYLKSFYNQERPHESLNDIPPAEYAQLKKEPLISKNCGHL